MSRIGKKGIPVSDKTEVQFNAGRLSVKGPKGSLERDFRPEINISVEGKIINVSPVRETNETRALWGAYASHIKNMIKGVNEGFEKKLITVEGVDKESVGSFTAKVRALKKPEPYKGKGFRYHDEVIRRKQGKKSV